MKYQALFSLRLRHQFYVNNRCRDFQIEPALCTQRLLKNYRCLLKPLPDGILVLTAVGDNDESLIPFSGNVTFAFELRLLNPDFSLFTELADLTSNTAPLFSNVGSGASSAAVALQLCGRTGSNIEPLMLRKGNATATFRLAGRPMDGCPVTEFILQGLPGAQIENFDVGKREITVNASASVAADQVLTVTYPVNRRLKQGVFADVEILSNDSMSRPGSGPSEFFIQFQAKARKWRYYLVTNRKSGNQFVVESDHRFTMFTADPSDILARALQLQYPGLALICFESTDTVLCQEAATRRIRLKLGNDAIYENLPNPSIRNICTVQEDFAFFQVIKDIRVPVTQST